MVRSNFAFSHFVYGLRLRADAPIPTLPILRKADDDCDVEVRLRERSTASTPFSHSPDYFYLGKNRNKEGEPSVKVARLGPDFYGFYYIDGPRFAVSRQGDKIWIDWPEGYSLEDVATFLVGPVLGFVLRLRGVIPLHASSVVLNGSAIALVGVKGSGKSTTAAGFAKLGNAILAEDLAPLVELDNQFWVCPGYPRINLWPESVLSLFGSPDALPLVTPDWGKRFLPLDKVGMMFQREASPLSMIFVLGPWDPNIRAPIFHELSNQSALLQLVINTYVNYLLDSEMRRREFEVVGRLISSVPVVKMTRPESAAPISDLCHAIADFAHNHGRGKDLPPTSSQRRQE